MYTQEFEKKLLLNESEFYTLRELLFSGENAKYDDQVNYYYDTQNHELNQKGITCRIRQKNGAFKGTIKTHFNNGDDGSHEENFRVDSLPYQYVVGSSMVTLQGSLYTRRCEIAPFPGIRLMLDQNWYLGICDFELEIEYLPACASQAEGVWGTILHILHRSYTETNRRFKSRRFFSRKSILLHNTNK